MSGVVELEVETFARWRERGEPHVLLDVREADELATASIAGAVWIPMGEIVARAAELPDDVPIVVMCHHGSRSAMVADYLHANGRPSVHNLRGGIDAYSARVDSSIARY